MEQQHSAATSSVFIIAHPDDESMFLVPTICSLLGNESTNNKCCYYLLCLSNGNYDGLGKTREVELVKACGHLGFSFEDVKIVADRLLQDSPRDRWPIHVVSGVVKEYIEEEIMKKTANAKVNIYTFDEGGVSGHINHVDTHLGVKHYLQQYATNTGVEGFQLETVTNIFQKYIPVYHWIVLILVWLGFGKKILQQPQQCYSYYAMYDPWMNWKCMSAHDSQFVWYRRLFVVFSSYTYENKWSKITTMTTTK